MAILGPQGQGTAGGTDITSALKGITLQISSLVKSVPIFFNSVISKANTLYVSLAGSTMTGPLILSGDPAVSNGAATKNYVDGKVSGGIGSANGFFVGTNIYSGSTTITVPSATQAYVQMWGSTGGSGGSKSAASGNTSSSGGTGAGGYLEKLLTGLTAGSTMAYTQDAGGAAGTTATDGGNAGPTTLVSGSVTLTCNGSTGSGFANLEVSGGTLGGTATGGDINVQGQRGGSAYGGGEGQQIANGGSTFFSLGADGVTAALGHSVAGNPGNPGGLKITWYT